MRISILNKKSKITMPDQDPVRKDSSRCGVICHTKRSGDSGCFGKNVIQNQDLAGKDSSRSSFFCNTKRPGKSGCFGKNVIQRLCVCFLCAVLVFTSCPVRVNASAAAMSAEMTAELTDLLYSLLANAMLAAGAENFEDISAESASDLFNTFMASLAESIGMGAPVGFEYVSDVGYVMDASDFTVTMSDGSVVTAEDIVAAWNNTDGTSAKKLAENAWKNFKVISGGSGGTGGNNNGNKFESVGWVEATKNMFQFLGAWAAGVFAGAISGLDRDDYFFNSKDAVVGTVTQYCYDGAYEMDGNGNYIVRGSSLHHYPDNASFNGEYYLVQFVDVVPYKVVLVEGNGSYTTYELRNGSLSSGQTSINLTETLFNSDGSVKVDPYSVNKSLTGLCSEFLYANIPIFSTPEAAINFLKKGTSTGLQNGMRYDYAALADAVADSFSPFAGVKVDANAIPELYPAISAAVDALPAPAPASDPSINTDTYIAAVADAVASNAPDADPNPDPEPDPVPELDPAVAIEVEKSKFDLTEIFPFCIPFDLVKLLDALCADPVAPKFEIPFVVPVLGIDMVWVIDMAIFDTAAEVFRVGIVVGYVIFLLMNTFKLIKW